MDDAAVRYSISRLRGYFSIIRARWNDDVAQLYTEVLAPMDEGPAQSAIRRIIDEGTTVVLPATIRTFYDEECRRAGTYRRYTPPESDEPIATPEEALAAMREGFREGWEKRHPGQSWESDADELMRGWYDRLPAFVRTMREARPRREPEYDPRLDPFADEFVTT